MENLVENVQTRVENVQTPLRKCAKPLRNVQNRVENVQIFWEDEPKLSVSAASGLQVEYSIVWWPIINSKNFGSEKGQFLHNILRISHELRIRIYFLSSRKPNTF